MPPHRFHAARIATLTCLSLNQATINDLFTSIEKSERRDVSRGLGSLILQEIRSGRVTDPEWGARMSAIAP